MPSAFRRSGATNRKRVTASGLSSLPESPSWSSSSSSSASSSHRTAPASSFRPPRGVKPWQGGTYLTSVGLSDLDTILGGGQLLGSSILLEEDRLWTRDLALTLVKYWCAEVRVSFCCFVSIYQMSVADVSCWKIIVFWHQLFSFLLFFSSARLYRKVSIW